MKMYQRKTSTKAEGEKYDYEKDDGFADNGHFDRWHNAA
jgi:hypothetical protein